MGGLGMPEGARVADRMAIGEVLAHYCARLDEYDIDGCCVVFTDDCTTDYGPGRGGVIVGREATRDRIAHGQSVFRRTHHQLGQSLVTFSGPDSADGVSYMITWHERFDGTRETVHLRYVDTFVRGDEGWRISSRRVEASGVVGFEGVDWYWVQRRPPEQEGTEVMGLSVRIDQDNCVSAGKCVADAPDAFGFDADELAEVLPGVSGLTDEQLIRLARQCPGRAILLSDAEGNDVAF